MMELLFIALVVGAIWKRVASTCYFVAAGLLTILHPLLLAKGLEPEVEKLSNLVFIMVAAGVTSVGISAVFHIRNNKIDDSIARFVHTNTKSVLGILIGTLLLLLSPIPVGFTSVLVGIITVFLLRVPARGITLVTALVALLEIFCVFFPQAHLQEAGAQLLFLMLLLLVLVSFRDAYVFQKHAE